MIKYLEDLLYQKTKDSQSEILFAQWNYDKKVIPSALQSVASLFPHYSLHDESHSITIINNIVRVVGKDNIEKLSAIDIWLILEAAYCHDIGMVVSSDKLIEALNSTKFLDFFKELINDPKSSLHEFAIQFQIVDGQIKFKSDIFNLELTDGIKFILAEYFRRMHAERSKEIIISPHSELSILSPRGVIPPRIFKILGDICSCHTKDFKNVLKLPFCEVGIDVEDAHPRFIACLLRIGDLLDLDNNRFSEVMLRTLTRVPIDTLNHKAKHLSIESFRVDKDKIEIKAKCSDYDTANITQHWFNFLNSEISSQMNNWNDIVPFKELCYLPMIGQLQVELINYDYIDGKDKPQFVVDTDKALELLQGAGLYDGDHQCIREILQNAVDATLIRIWLEHHEENEFLTPNDLTLDIVKKYPITFEIFERQSTLDHKEWKINIRDCGIGISSEDLKYLMKTGSSSKNKNKSRIIDNMPIWMRPSGTFGIGFQSVFMITDQVKIETKSFFDEQFQKIELNSPNSQKDGDILIKRDKSSHSVKPHTQLTFDYTTNLIPPSYSVSMSGGFASKIANNYDPFVNDSLDVELGKIIDEVIAFSSMSYLPVILKIDGKEFKFQNFKANQFQFYDNENSLEFNIYPNDSFGRYRVNTYYKNQTVVNDFNIAFLGFAINIHKDKASDVLTINRNKITKEYSKKLIRQIFKSAYNIITTHFDEIFKDSRQKEVGSMFLDYYADQSFLESFDVSKFRQWENFEINIEDMSVTIKSLLESTEVLMLNYDNRYKADRDYGDKYKIEGNELTITFPTGRPVYNYTEFLLNKFSDILVSVCNIEDPEKNYKIFTYNKLPIDLYKVTDLKSIILALRNGHTYSSRAIIPCFDEFKKLRIKDNPPPHYVNYYLLEDKLHLPFPKMMSPFVREENEIEDGNEEGEKVLKLVINEKFYDWVYENRYHENVTKEEIVREYGIFCSKIDLKEVNSQK